MTARTYITAPADPFYRHHVTAAVDTLISRRILLLASNPAVSGQTAWPIDLWWAELTHPYWEFTDGLLITGQQQYSGAAAARLVIEALGR
jgi:hypothetical protein